jgi:hypothetical protein
MAQKWRLIFNNMGGHLIDAEIPEAGNSNLFFLWVI